MNEINRLEVMMEQGLEDAKVKPTLLSQKLDVEVEQLKNRLSDLSFNN